MNKISLQVESLSDLLRLVPLQDPRGRRRWIMIQLTYQELYRINPVEVTEIQLRGETFIGGHDLLAYYS